jgi:zinc-ribbon domain
MYCPKCGAQAPSNQKFCRSCGQDLNMVSQVVTGQPVTDTCKRGPMIWGIIMFLGGAALGSVIKILNKEGIHVAGGFTPYLMALIILMIFASFGLMIYSMSPLMSGRRRLPQAEGGSARTTKAQPVALPESMPAITEYTTELFDGEGAVVRAGTTAPQSE